MWLLFCTLWLLLQPPETVVCGLGEGNVDLQSLDVDKYLEVVNRPFVESHILSDGSTVDCVRIEEQLSLQHPLLKEHVVLKKPLSFPGVEEEEDLQAQRAPPKWQLFHREVGGCPTSSIPVRRLQKEDVQKFLNADGSHKKYSVNATAPLGKLSGKKRRWQPPGAAGSHQYAIVEEVGSFSGATAYISTWAPYVASQSDFSLSQLWVGSGEGSGTNTVEAGWQTYPLLNGDYWPHLFIFWTADGYTTTGCYNLRCPAFLQINPSVVLGGAMSSISFPSSPIYNKFLIYKDPSGWWLQINGEWVGYWPFTLFNSLQSSASWIQWGGEVCLTVPNSKTDMGSGFFPSAGPNKAASQHTLGSVDSSLNLQDARNLFMFNTDSSRYTSQVRYRTQAGTSLLFGGPGL